MAATGGTVHLPPGTITTGEIVLPVGKHVSLVGAGIGVTTIIPARPNQRILRAQSTREAPDRRLHVEAIHIGGFTIQANPQGSTGEAILLDRFRTDVLEDVEFTDTGTGHWTTGILLTSPNHCYGNVLRHIVVAGQKHGPTTVISFQNVNPADVADSASSAPNVWANANANAIENIWVYANGGIDVVIDAARSASTTITNGLIEDNPTAIGVWPGTHNTITGVWFEKLKEPLHLAAASDFTGKSNAVAIGGNYFSGGLPEAIARSPTLRGEPPSPVGWTTGGGPPEGGCKTGSLYTNTAGAYGSTLYACEAGVWVAK